MCQQTQVATVIPYYEKWMRALPTVEALAEADEATVLTLWQGLGYYRRAKSLMSGARLIASTRWPDSASAWRAVPGVGAYTAGAIASMALGERAAVVDGNVERVYARITANSKGGSALNREAWYWAKEQIKGIDQPAMWNQALMELGAIVCTPKAPKCEQCPVNGGCTAYRTDNVSLYPSPSPRNAQVRVDKVISVSHRDGEFALKQVTDGPWWRGMWEFDGDGGQLVGEFKFVVTNHRITAQVMLGEGEDLGKGARWVQESELESYAMPAPQRRALKLVKEWLKRYES